MRNAPERRTFAPTMSSHHGGGSWEVLPTVTEHPPRRRREQLLLVDMLLVSFPRTDPRFVFGLCTFGCTCVLAVSRFTGR